VRKERTPYLRSTNHLVHEEERQQSCYRDLARDSGVT
jgi:hypothetical protein